MKTILLALACYAGMFLFTYFLGAYISSNIDPREWSADARYFQAFASFVGTVFYVLFDKDLL